MQEIFLAMSRSGRFVDCFRFCLIVAAIIEPVLADFISELCTGIDPIATGDDNHKGGDAANSLLPTPSNDQATVNVTKEFVTEGKVISVTFETFCSRDGDGNSKIKSCSVEQDKQPPLRVTQKAGRLRMFFAAQDDYFTLECSEVDQPKIVKSFTGGLCASVFQTPGNWEDRASDKFAKEPPILRTAALPVDGDELIVFENIAFTIACLGTATPQILKCVPGRPNRLGHASSAFADEQVDFLNGTAEYRLDCKRFGTPTISLLHPGSPTRFPDELCKAEIAKYKKNFVAFGKSLSNADERQTAIPADITANTKVVFNIQFTVACYRTPPIIDGCTRFSGGMFRSNFKTAAGTEGTFKSKKHGKYLLKCKEYERPVITSQDSGSKSKPKR